MKYAFRITKFLIVGIATGGFIWLSYASTHYGHGYSAKERASMDRLVESHVAFRIKQQPMSSYQREAVMDLWQLSEADIAKPVIFFK